MPVRKEPWAAGQPSWVDLMVPDSGAAQEFYTGLFGWKYSESNEEFGHYAVATLDGEAVAGVVPTQGPAGPPPAWTTYLEAPDLTRTIERLTAAGGSVVMPAMTIAEFGAMAIVADPTGAVFGLWQSGQHTGVDRYNDPGSLVWSEAMVRDLDAGRAFYAQVFGYTYEDVEPGLAYSVARLDGSPIAGIGDVALIGADVPSHWRTYFAVADLGDTLAQLPGLGGRVIAEPWDTQFGRIAVVAGPAGEVFSLNQAPTG